MKKYVLKLTELVFVNKTKGELITVIDFATR